ncbi:heavy-metal-associated domain-containing protein [Cellulophaga baltica]|uniref:heavy-metal-associated domain-containing protein n=1 Tax=Cellulophaga baltica TaxID=76594 RepID=UPI0024940BC4|nr:heavy-metal-associated domain-containing protein [Cellulophaga baltica]
MQNSITVQNLKCVGCANTIKNKISEIENISSIEIDIDSSNISFSTKNNEDVLRVKDKLKAIGYPSIDEDNSLVSKAKSFVSCATGKISS